MGAYLGYLNKKQEQRRIAAGRPGAVPDTVSLLSSFLLICLAEVLGVWQSIMTLEAAEAYKASITLANEPNGAIAENAHAFEDLTDFQVSGTPICSGHCTI